MSKETNDLSVEVINSLKELGSKTDKLMTGGSDRHYGGWVFNPKTGRNQFAISKRELENWIDSQTPSAFRTRAQNKLSNDGKLENAFLPVDGLTSIIGDTVLKYEQRVSVIKDMADAGLRKTVPITTRAAVNYAFQSDVEPSVDMDGTSTPFDSGSYDDYPVPILLVSMGIRNNFRDPQMALSDRANEVARKVANAEEELFFKGNALQWFAGRIASSALLCNGFTNATGATAWTGYDTSVSDLYDAIRNNLLDPLTERGFGNIHIYAPSADKSGVFYDVQYSGRQRSLHGMLVAGAKESPEGGLVNAVHYTKALGTGTILAVSFDAVDFVEAMPPTIIPVPSKDEGTSSALKLVCARVPRIKPDYDNVVGSAYGS